MAATAAGVAHEVGFQVATAAAAEVPMVDTADHLSLTTR
jgi:hypothetical protein